MHTLWYIAFQFEFWQVFSNPAFWQEVSDAATAAAATVAIFALIFTARSAAEIRNQTKSASDAAVATRDAARATRDAAKAGAAGSVSQAYGEITQKMSRINDILLNKREWIPYFYENREPSRHLDDLERQQLNLFCEAIVDCADVLMEQRGTAQEISTMDWSTWDTYFRFLYNYSPVLRDFIPENLDYYPDYELVIFGYIVVRDSLTGLIVSTWHAREIDLDEKIDQDYAELFGDPLPSYVGVVGYPWVRTWVIESAPNPQLAEPNPQGDPAMIAAVEMLKSQLARVHVRTQGEVDQDTAETLQSWVLGTLAASVQIQEVHVHTSASKTPAAKYDLRTTNREATNRELYLLPRFKQL